MDSRELIRQFITGLLEMKGERSDVSDTDSLLTEGLIDSMDVVQTVLFLEENFGMDFSVHAFDPDEFESIESIYRMVQSQALL
jgi:acyl carrier protein